MKSFIPLFFFVFIFLNFVSGATLWNSNVVGVVVGESPYNLTTLIGNFTNFLNLTDTPNTYAGDGGDCVKVNVGETALEFGVCSASAESDPLWTSNYTTYNASWSSIQNDSYYLVSNPFGYFNATNPSPDTNISDTNETVRFNTLVGTNCTSGNAYTNITSAGDLICSAISATESDPLWTSNYTTYNASWSSIQNDSYYLVSNPFGYFNATNPSPDTNISDTNETSFVNNLTATNCSAGYVYYGIYSNGTLICVADTDTDTNISDTNCSDAGDCPNILYTANESDLNVNSSDYWDGINTYNNTQFEVNGGVIWILQSWFSNLFDALFGAKTTDDLSEGALNKYDNQSWNQSHADTLYSNNSDTNETSFVNNLTATNCTGTDKYSSIYTNGTLVCTEDSTFNASYLTFESDPLWLDNFTKFNDSWSSTENTSYYLVSNPFNFFNATNPSPDTNISDTNFSSGGTSTGSINISGANFTISLGQFVCFSQTCDAWIKYEYHNTTIMLNETNNQWIVSNETGVFIQG